MFNDEEQFAFQKMQGFSTVDGFVEVTECLGDMIKYVANEPSVGLFYIQQHIQNATPNLLNLQNNVVQKSHEMALHAEDSEDSISTIRSMKECGSVIADDMLRDIKSSLSIISSKQQKRGLIDSSASAFHMGRSGSWGSGAWSRSSSSSQQDFENPTGYFSSVIKSAKLKASNLRWTQAETQKEKPMGAKDEASSSDADAPLLPDPEVVEVPISSPTAREGQQVSAPAEDSLPEEEILALAHKYEEFKADKEAELEEWLGGLSNQVSNGKQADEV